MHIVGLRIRVGPDSHTLAKKGDQVHCVVGEHMPSPLSLLSSADLHSPCTFPGLRCLARESPPPCACCHSVQVVLNFEQRSDRWLYSDWDFVFPGLFFYLPWLHFSLEICVLGIDLALEELSIWICLIVQCCLVFEAIVCPWWRAELWLGFSSPEIAPSLWGLDEYRRRMVCKVIWFSETSDLSPGSDKWSWEQSWAANLFTRCL